MVKGRFENDAKSRLETMKSRNGADCTVAVNSSPLSICPSPVKEHDQFHLLAFFWPHREASAFASSVWTSEVDAHLQNGRWCVVLDVLISLH